MLLRKMISVTSGWARLSPETQRLTKLSLVEFVQAGSDGARVGRRVMSAVVDVIGDLAGVIIRRGEWGELLPLLVQWTSATSGAAGGMSLREAALMILRSLCVSIDDVLRQHVSSLCDILQACLNHPAILQNASAKQSPPSWILPEIVATLHLASSVIHLISINNDGDDDEDGSCHHSSSGAHNMMAVISKLVPGMIVGMEIIHSTENNDVRIPKPCVYPCLYLILRDNVCQFVVDCGRS